MDKIVCSLEEWDSVIGYYRPNGSSKTWYLKELKELRLPLMWENWTVFSEQGELFDRGYFENLITPKLLDNIDYQTQVKVGDNPHIYIIHISTHSFFKTNEPIGFSCVSEKYLNDVRMGRAMIAMFFIYEGYSGILGNDDFETIERWRIRSGLPEGSIYYLNGNLLSREIVEGKGYGFHARGIHYFEPWNKYNGPSVGFNPKNNKNLFLSYNRATRHHRILMASDLISEGLFERGLVSMNKLDYPLPIQTSREVEDYLVQNTPFIIDSKYNLVNNLACNITIEDYESTFVSLVTETLVDEGTLFFSEKIWKPIMVGHPFLLFGNRGSLSYLRNLGYQTYGQWFDESYDDIVDRGERSGKIIENLTKYSRYSIDDLRRIRTEMNEVCEFNRNHYHNLYNQKYYSGDKNTQIKDVLEEIWCKIRG